MIDRFILNMQLFGTAILIWFHYLVTNSHKWGQNLIEEITYFYKHVFVEELLRV